MVVDVLRIVLERAEICGGADVSHRNLGIIDHDGSRLGFLVIGITDHPIQLTLSDLAEIEGYPLVSLVA